MEAALLGLSSGLVCVASCGPVVLPWLAAERAGYGGTTKRLGLFLSGRLAGYLAFATFAWAAGLVLSARSAKAALLFAAAHVALAAWLVAYAARRRDRGCAECGRSTGGHGGRSGPILLGLLTGLSPCPPFVAAGVRATETGSLDGALAFFALFFAGTLVWFIPFTAVAALRRIEALGAVARLTSLIVAAYYGYLGAAALGGALIHG